MHNLIIKKISFVEECASESFGKRNLIHWLIIERDRETVTSSEEKKWHDTINSFPVQLNINITKK